MRRLLLILFAIISCSVWADTARYDIIPLPESVEMQGKSPFVLNSNTRIVCQHLTDDVIRNANFLQEYIKKNVGLHISLSSDNKKGNAIVLLLDSKVVAEEGYVLTVNDKNITIAARTAAGMFYGIQTMRKSLPTHVCEEVILPAVVITDAPRYRYRGMMLDCGRHFFPVSFVKEFIDLMALHNMNNFHWHLTEDQGWRIEIKKYPQLTAIGSCRRETVVAHNSQVYDGTPYGGYYTQDDAREIVEYARQRYITVIPEIDMPGHQVSALASIPELGCTGGPYAVGTSWGVYSDILCMGNEKTYEFCEDVLTEILDIFPSKMIHIGGDEAPKKRTEKCPKCNSLMEREHLTLNNIQGYFTKRIEKFLNERGRSIVGWDEILESDVNQSATIHCWRKPDYGIKAAQLGHDVIMSPKQFCYLDHYQVDPKKNNEPVAFGGFLPLEKVYNMTSLPDSVAEQDKKHILGVQGNLWTEYVATPNHAIYMLLPRMSALSEECWCKTKGTYDVFLPRMARLTNLFDIYGWGYAKHLWPEKIVVQDR